MILKTNKHEGHVVLSNMYLQCQNLTVQISVVYERSSFIWILGDDDSSLAETFGDQTRALHK